MDKTELNDELSPKSLSQTKDNSQGIRSLNHSTFYIKTDKETNVREVMLTDAAYFYFSLKSHLLLPFP